VYQKVEKKKSRTGNEFGSLSRRKEQQANTDEKKGLGSRGGEEISKAKERRERKKKKKKYGSIFRKARRGKNPAGFPCAEKVPDRKRRGTVFPGTKNAQWTQSPGSGVG